MSDDFTPDEEPEPTEVFEQYDETEDDPQAAGVGDEWDPTQLSESEIDDEANEEIGANLDDPDKFAVLDGGMDDPDGRQATE